MTKENFYIFFGSRLKTLRKNHGITQSELSKYLDISPTALVNYENGKRKIPLDVAIQIAGFFNVGLDSIAMGSNKDHLEPWRKEFKNVIFKPHEIDELINYSKYILFKRNDC